MIIKKSKKLLNFINQRRKKHYKEAGVVYEGDWSYDQISDFVLKLHYQDYRILVLKHPPTEVFTENKTIPKPKFVKPPRRVINA